jgi:predicted AAA+ superfamily ATPase
MTSLAPGSIIYIANPAPDSIIARVIERRIKGRLIAAIDSTPAVALLGPRQVDKTTLALEIGENQPSVYLDLESTSDRAKLADPEAYLSGYEDKLVILDEVHRAPEPLNRVGVWT